MSLNTLSYLSATFPWKKSWFNCKMPKYRLLGCFRFVLFALLISVLNQIMERKSRKKIDGYFFNSPLRNFWKELALALVQTFSIQAMAVDAWDPYTAIPTLYLGKWLQREAEDLLRVGWPRSQCFRSRVLESEDWTLFQTYREVSVLPVGWQLPLWLLCGLHFLSTLLTQDPGSLASCQDHCEDRQQRCRLSKAATALRRGCRRSESQRQICIPGQRRREGQMWERAERQDNTDARRGQDAKRN